MLLEVKDLSVGFEAPEGVLTAVDGVNFSLGAEGTLCLVGESGSGKSVTALSLAALLPSPPAKRLNGSIIFEGQNLSKMHPAGLNSLRGDRIGMIFQEPMTSLNPVFTIGEQIAEPLRLHKKLSNKAALEKAVDLLRQVGITSPEQRIKDYPHQLSGGQRQRVMIAMALSCNPSLLIADEPTTALDVSSQGQILQLMKELRQGYGAAMLLITHDLNVVAQTGGEVAVMYCGSIVESGPAAEVLASPAHPYTQGLLRSRPQISGSTSRAKRKPLTPIPGTVPPLGKRPAGCAFSTRCPLASAHCHSEKPPLQGDSTRKHACWL